MDSGRAGRARSKTFGAGITEVPLPRALRVGPVAPKSFSGKAALGRWLGRTRPAELFFPGCRSCRSSSSRPPGGPPPARTDGTFHALGALGSMVWVEMVRVVSFGVRIERGIPRLRSKRRLNWGSRLLTWRQVRRLSRRGRAGRVMCLHGDHPFFHGRIPVPVPHDPTPARLPLVASRSRRRVTCH